ncbi:LysR family transcriptional regulator [Sorangium sp. So ce385]|uniref:LysR family transcriptional regulator n=1 Tax=Sorangium sp. So ce385 TaxID=3133308 RepID=UPI003F5C0CE7
MAASDFEVSVPQLRCFLAVVDAGSVAEAGRRLEMSAASVSKAITRLEDGAGVRLLHRSTHAIALTDAGEALLEPAREAVRAAEAFAETAAHASARGDGGMVRLTAAAGMVRHVIAPLVGELARVHPDIRVDIRVTSRVLDLAEGDREPDERDVCRLRPLVGYRWRRDPRRKHGLAHRGRRRLEHHGREGAGREGLAVRRQELRGQVRSVAEGGGIANRSSVCRNSCHGAERGRRSSGRARS